MRKSDSPIRWMDLMISVLDNGLKNTEDCKLLDTHCLNVPMYRYLVGREHLGLSSMPHEAKYF